MANNNWTLDGELVSFTHKNDKLGIGTIRNTQVYKNQKYTSVVEVNFWGEQATILANIPIGSTLEVEGRLKMDTWEYQGKEMSKLKLNCTKCKVTNIPDSADIPF